MTYLSLLETWNRKINLISPTTIRDAWTRHFIDSVQILDSYQPRSGIWGDLGSGGGFPGLIVAILCAERFPETKAVLIESDLRKCTFLRTVIRETGIDAKVLSDRIETAPPLDAQSISARALAPLPVLLGYVNRHLAPGGTAMLPKGENWQAEIAEAGESWNFKFTAHKSKTNPQAVVLEIGELTHV
ncbi:16S rRNA (guanine(527)-N(7))-methyltransferase RsmG [Primorskyibacter sp. 2E107]|uniref:16S rRNA (guanine(527)-N(7))-methyltransferase RsmG n=1 Tax=Primorskyibacter sp. 2E107 TaxID=3403458 RepID=UPI003AF97D6E